MDIKFPTGIGAIVAILVFLLAVIFIVIGKLDITVGALIAALAVARLT